MNEQWRPEGCHGNHKNGVKSDNRASNLEWVGQSENQRHAHRLGLYRMDGENHPQSKITDADALEVVRAIKNGTPQDLVAHQFGISQTLVSRIANGKRRPHVLRAYERDAGKEAAT